MSERQPTNREKSLTPKRGKHWCRHCDHQLIHDGQKCPACGKKDVKRKLKKYHCYE